MNANTKSTSTTTTTTTPPVKTAPTTEKAVKTAHDAIDSAQGKAEELETKVRLEAARLAEKYKSGEGIAKQQIDETLSKIDGFVKEKPVAAAGMAFAAGILATLLLRK